MVDPVEEIHRPADLSLIQLCSLILDETIFKTTYTTLKIIKDVKKETELDSLLVFLVIQNSTLSRVNNNS